MPLYRYRAMSTEGRTVIGVYAGDNSAAVRDHLLSRDLYPQKVSRQFRLLPRGASQSQLLAFFQSFELLLNSGLGAVESLNLAIGKVIDPPLRQQLDAVLHAVRSGQSLGDAFSTEQGYFESHWIAALRAGEASGRLAESVRMYCRHRERLEDVKRKASAAITYPLILIAMIAVVLAVLMTFVVPRLSDGYRSLGSDLPTLTQWVVAASESFPFLVAGGLVVGFMAVISARQLLTAQTRARVRRNLLDRVPLLGRIRTEMRVVNIAATLSMLVDAGHSLQRSLRLMAGTEQDADLAARLQLAAAAIERGENPSAILAAQQLFPEFAMQLIEAGERSGLEVALQRVAGFYIGHLDMSVQRFVSVIEPALMLLIGLIIGVVVVAVYMPIFSMTQVLG